jgi:hypothetical protein
MAEAMFKAMGCTRDSDTRIDVGTIDLRNSLSLTTSAKMIVTLGEGRPTITSTADQGGYIFTNLNASGKSFDLSIPTSYYYYAGTNARVASPITYSVDGRAMFHGIVDAEKTGQIVKNSNLQITQQTTGTASVNVISLGNGQAQLTVGATGGTTTIKLKGFTAGSGYDIIVNSVTVERKTAASDGSVTFTRTFGASDSVQVKPTSGAPIPPPPTPVDPPSMPYGPSSVPIPGGMIPPIASDEVGLVQQSDASTLVALAATAAPAPRQGRILPDQG